MKKYLFCLTLLLCALPMWATAETTWVRAGKLVDVERGRVLNDQLVRIEGDREGPNR